jgi:hypothetical protein
MSTRATYEMDGHTFYIHHDGYPSGAAQYFRNAVEFTPEAPNASFADCFIKANARAELTGSHDTHGDTDYQYTITTDKTGAKRVTVKRRSWAVGGYHLTVEQPLSAFILANSSEPQAA